jgi:hypothetical protein
MQEILSGKRLIKISNHWSSSKTYSISDYWWRSSGMVYMAKNKLENANWDMIIPTVKFLPEESKLVFHKTSKFPRHKLGLTTFKRKIKEKGADFIVGNFKKLHPTDIQHYLNAYETEDAIFVTQLSTIEIAQFIIDCKIDLSNATHYSNYELLCVTDENRFHFFNPGLDGAV